MNPSDEDHLPSYRVRPRFQIVIPFSKEKIIEKISEGLNKQDAKCKGWIHESGFGKLFLPIEHQHYWSPELNLSIENKDQGSLLSGLYGPKPAIWTMFVFFYFVIGFSIVVISVIGLSNIYLNKSGIILWLVPILILVFLSLYLVAYLGQKVGYDQMIILHQFLEASLGIEIIGDENHEK